MAIENHMSETAGSMVHNVAPPTGQEPEIPLLVPLSELLLIERAMRRDAPAADPATSRGSPAPVLAEPAVSCPGVVVLGDGDVELETRVVVGLARDGFEAWRLLVTGTVNPAVNPAGRNPRRLIAMAIAPDDMPAPADLAEILVPVTALERLGIRDPLRVHGWYLCTPDLDTRHAAHDRGRP